MSLEKLHNYVRGVMQRNVVQIDEHDKKKMLELLPHSQEVKSTLAGNQCKIVRRTLDRMHIWPQPAQEIELFVMAHRLKKAIEIDDWPTCNKCGASVHIKCLSAPKFHQQEVDYLLRLMDSQESSMMLTGDATQEFWEELREKINSLERM